MNANGFVLAITPNLAIVLFIVEFALAAMFSHKFVNDLRDNEVVPGGILLAITNGMCPTGPIRRVGIINGISTFITICKLACVYIIMKYFNQTPGLLTAVCEQPDLFRCFTEEDVVGLNCTLKKYNSSLPIVSPRLCRAGESKNEFALTASTILTLCLVVISVPAGYLITYLIRKDKLKSLDTLFGKFTSPFKNCLTCFTNTKFFLQSGADELSSF